MDGRRGQVAHETTRHAPTPATQFPCSKEVPLNIR